MVNENIRSSCSRLLSQETSLKRISSVKSWDQFIGWLQQPFASDQIMQVTIRLRLTESLNQAWSGLLILLYLHSSQNVFRPFQIKVAQAMAIQLFNGIEYVYVCLIKYEFLKTNRDHVDNNSQRLLEQSSSIILIETRAVVHLRHPSQYRWCLDSKNLPVFYKVFEIGLSIENGVNDMKWSLPGRFHQFSQTCSQSGLNMKSNLLTSAIPVDLVLALCQIRFQIGVFTHDVRHFYGYSINLVGWPPFTSRNFVLLLAIPGFHEVVQLWGRILQNNEMHGHQLKCDNFGTVFNECQEFRICYRFFSKNTLTFLEELGVPHKSVFFDLAKLSVGVEVRNHKLLPFSSRLVFFVEALGRPTNSCHFENFELEFRKNDFSHNNFIFMSLHL